MDKLIFSACPFLPWKVLSYRSWTRMNMKLFVAIKQIHGCFLLSKVQGLKSLSVHYHFAWLSSTTVAKGHQMNSNLQSSSRFTKLGTVFDLLSYSELFLVFDDEIFHRNTAAHLARSILAWAIAIFLTSYFPCIPVSYFSSTFTPCYDSMRKYGCWNALFWQFNLCLWNFSRLVYLYLYEEPILCPFYSLLFFTESISITDARNVQYNKYLACLPGF